MDADTFDATNPFFKYDLNEVCGVCTEKLDTQKSYSLKKQISDDEDLMTYQVLESISKFKLQENGTSFICHTCFQNANAAYKFQKLCNKAQLFLDTFIEHQSKFTAELQTAEQTPVEDAQMQLNEDDDDVKTKRKKTVKGQVPCKVCHKLIRTENMKVHMRIHTGERPYKCQHCGSTFNQRSALYNHKLLHADKPGFICKVCGRAFYQPSHLRLHERRHSEERPFKCELCDLSFKMKQGLKMHSSVHTAETPFTCEICAKSFKRRKTLILHQKIHTGDRQHECPICSRTFVQKVSLTSHLRTHNNAETSANIKADSQLDFQNDDISEIVDTLL